MSCTLQGHVFAYKLRESTKWRWMELDLALKFILEYKRVRIRILYQRTWKSSKVLQLYIQETFNNKIITSDISIEMRTKVTSFFFFFLSPVIYYKNRANLFKVFIKVGIHNFPYGIKYLFKKREWSL